MTQNNDKMPEQIEVAKITAMGETWLAVIDGDEKGCITNKTKYIRADKIEQLQTDDMRAKNWGAIGFERITSNFSDIERQFPQEVYDVRQYLQSSSAKIEAQS